MSSVHWLASLPSSPPSHVFSNAMQPTSPVSTSPSLGPSVSEAFPPVVLSPLVKEKMNYRCTYDPALDTSVVKKSAGPLYRHFKPSATIISRPAKDPRLRLAYPSPLSGPPKTLSQKSSLVAGLSRCSKGRQTFHSQVERLRPYPFDKNSVGPPPPPPPSAILITELSNLVTGEQVRNHFVKFGRVAECEIKLDPQTGGSLGICWLRFVNDLDSPPDGSSKDSSGKGKPRLANSSRGLQDGHQCAVEATKKANGARIGIMLTTGPTQSTSMLRKPHKSQSNWGIRCELDGTGSKCAKAVAHALRKPHYPPSLLPQDSVVQAFPMNHPSLPQKLSPNTVVHPDHSEPHQSSHASPTPFSDKLEIHLPSSVGRPPAHPTNPSDGSKSCHPTLSKPVTPTHSAVPSLPFPSPDASKPLLAKVTPDAQNAPQAGKREHDVISSTFTANIGSGGGHMMPSAMRHQLVGNQSRGKIAAGFLAAAQNAALIAAKKAGIQLSSQAQTTSNQAPPCTTSSSAAHPGRSFSGDFDSLLSRTESSSTRLHMLSKPNAEDMDEDDDSSESEDEDAKAERLKEAQREALIASRKANFNQLAPMSIDKHGQAANLRSQSYQPHHSANLNASNIATQQPSDLMKLSLSWPNNCIGVNKSIKMEILKRLSINQKPFVTINRIEISKSDIRARIPQGPAELKLYLADFEPSQVMTDGQMWYITFEQPHLAQKVFNFMNQMASVGKKIPCGLHEPISNDDYRYLSENSLQIPPPRSHLAPVKPPEMSSLPSRPALPLTDDELIQRATAMILDELRATFLRDLKNRIVSGKIRDLLKDDQQIQFSRPSQPAVQTPVSLPATSLVGATASTRSKVNEVFSLDAQHTVKLPSFAKRKPAPRTSGPTEMDRSTRQTTAPNLPPKPNGYLGSHSHESGSETPKPLRSRKMEDDTMSIASSDFLPRPLRRSESHEVSRGDEDTRLLTDDDEDHKSTYSAMSIPAIPPMGKVVKKKIRKRFKKAVTYTSSEEEADEEEVLAQPDWKRAKYGQLSPELAVESAARKMVVAEKLLGPQSPGKGNPEVYEADDAATIEEIILDSPRGEERSAFALQMIAQTSLRSPIGQHDTLIQTGDEGDLNLRPKKKQKRVPRAKIDSSELIAHHGPLNAYDFEVAEDEEELYYVKCVLERLRVGQSPYPTRPLVAAAPGNFSGSPNKVGSNDPAARAALVSVKEVIEEGKEKETPGRADEPLPPHATGSSRTQGYYHITSSQKAFYLPQRNKAIIDVSAIANHQSGANSNAMALAVSRSTRVDSRRFVINMEQNKRASASASVEVVADVLKFNQLRTRKKQLKFARSPIHDWGLYAMEMIPAGEMVIEYVGEVIRQAVADRREKAYERMGIGSSYLFRVDDDLVVDATRKGNLGRLINHCCAPNCTAKIITINGEKKIVIYAKATIELGDEVTYDYHFPKEDVKIPCLCGSPKCKGTLN